MKLKYIALNDDNHLLVSKKDLTEHNLPKLISDLNEIGFNLGSGHESVEIITAGESYVLKLEPHTSHSLQLVYFDPIKING